MPGLVAYLEIYWALESWPSLLGFLAGMVTLGLHMFFWLTLTLMLGTFFDSWGPIIGIPLAFSFGQQFIGGFLPFLLYLFPWALSVPIGDEYPSLTSSFINGEAPFSCIPLIAAAFFSVVFIGVAIWRFGQEEF